MKNIVATLTLVFVTHAAHADSNEPCRNEAIGAAITYVASSSVMKAQSLKGVVIEEIGTSLVEKKGRFRKFQVQLGVGDKEQTYPYILHVETDLIPGEKFCGTGEITVVDNTEFSN